ncbi:MAG TPA: hypothetical protein VHV82_18615 [Sporichthyaceae bacterium]|jgi:hypothetical protein|nr:hypothetical protein [Sporichthyaceae bacterium]
MRNLMTAASLVACAAAGPLLAPTVAHAAAPLADQLILCDGNRGIPLQVTVENLTYDSTGPVPFTLKGGCQTIVDGNPADDPNGTPISATYRLAFEPGTKNPQDMITIVTNSSQTRTVQGDETNVAISSLEGVQVTFATPD